MVAPTVSSVTPSEGGTLGETFVEIAGTDFNDEISGGTVRVLFGGVESPEYGVVSATRIIALTPRNATPGDVDVVVENVTPPGPSVEPGTLSDGFTYKRRSIATRRDFSTDGAIRTITRALVADLRAHVIENVHHDAHPEYADDEDALVPQEHQAQAPSLKVLGPRIQEDRFRSINGRSSIDNGDGTFRIVSEPVTVFLFWDVVGLGRSGGEAQNLWNSFCDWLKRTPDLQVFANGVDDTDGTVSIQVDPVWEQRADFRSRATREANFQWTEQIRMQGVQVHGDQIGLGSEVTEDVTLAVEKIPEP